MQLTGPVFLLIFLPLSLLLVLPVPKPHRLKALAAVSAIWYILANRGNPIGAGAVFVLVLFAYAMVLPAKERLPRLRLFFGTVLPLLLLLAARLAAEYGPESYVYPYGLTFVVLGAISAVTDRMRGEAPRPRNFAEFAGFLLFFPTLLMGPIVRWKNYREITDGMENSLGRFCEGLCLYMSGTVKCVAVAAVLLRSMRQIVNYANGEIHYLTALLLPLLAFFSFYFFLTGSSDLARGTAAMFGLRLPRNRGAVLFSRDPFKFLYGFILTLHAYLVDYVVRPIANRFGGRTGRLAAVSAVPMLWALFFRTRPEMLLFVLPFLLLFLLFVRQGNRRVLLHPLPRICLSVLCTVAFAFFALAVLFENPQDLFTLFSSISRNDVYGFYYIQSAVTGSRYLMIGAILLPLYLVLAHFRAPLERKMGKKLLAVFHCTETALLFAAFLLTLVYFVPQFPGYADIPHPVLYL